MATLADLNVVIGADLDGFEAALNRAEGSLSGFGSFAKTAIAGAAAAVAASIVGLGTESLKAAGDIQALEKGFAATYKGALPLADALAKVKELAKLPGLSLKEAIAGATNLQAASFSADLATRALGAFGNALAIVGKGSADLSGVSLALGQIASKGKISAEEIGQLAERVPQIRGAIKAAFGTSDSQALQKLNIDATTFVDGIVKQLERLPKATGGINNALENASDAYGKALAAFGTSLNNAFNIEGIINKATDVLEYFRSAAAGLEPVFKSVGDSLSFYFGQNGEGGRVFSDLADAAINAGAAIKEITSGGGGFLQLLKSAEPLSFAIREIGDGVTAILETFYGISKAISGIASLDLKTAFAGGKQAVEGLTRPIRSLFGLIEQKSANFSEFFGLVPPPAKEAATAIEQVVKALGGLSADQLKALDALEKKLLDNRNASRALGADYEFLKNKASILEGGVKSLTEVGFAPGSKVVQDYVKQLRGVPQALDQIAGRMVKGTEKLFATPDFELPKANLSQDAPFILPNYEATFANAAAQVARGGGQVTDAFDAFGQKLTEAQLNSLDRQRDFNTNYEGLIDNLSTSVGPLLAGFAAQFGEALGTIATGTSSAADAIQVLFGGIISSLGSFMSDFGQKLIAIGIGKLALDSLFNGPQGGPLAIAAGVGLVALAGIVSAVGKGAAASVGSIGSGGSSLASQPRTNYGGASTGSQQPLKIEAVFTIKGRDLQAIGRLGEYRELRTR